MAKIENILDSIVEYYNKSPKKETGTFFKVKSDTFNIGKLHFSFVTFNATTGKQVNSIDFYVDMRKGDGGLVLCQDILSGKIAKEMEIEKQNRLKKDPNSKFASPTRVFQGGLSAQRAKEKNIRSDGNAQARILKLSSGNTFPYIFSCEEGPGKETSEGLIVPTYSGKPEKIIRVGISQNDLKALALAVNSHYTAFLSAKYAVDAFAKEKERRKNSEKG